MPVMLAAQEAEISKLRVQSQPMQIFPHLEKTLHQKKKAGGVAKGVGSQFKLQY
jgi:hypothetical protein